MLTVCSKLVDNLGQAVRRQLVDGLLADLLQYVRFLRVYTRKNAQVVTSLQTSCYKSANKLLQVCKQVVTSLQTSCQQVVFALFVPSKPVAGSQFLGGALQKECNRGVGMISTFVLAASFLFQLRKIGIERNVLLHCNSIILVLNFVSL